MCLCSNHVLYELGSVTCSVFLGLYMCCKLFRMCIIWFGLPLSGEATSTEWLSFVIVHGCGFFFDFQ